MVYKSSFQKFKNKLVKTQKCYELYCYNSFFYRFNQFNLIDTRNDIHLSCQEIWIINTKKVVINHF